VKEAIAIWRVVSVGAADVLPSILLPHEGPLRFVGLAFPKAFPNIFPPGRRYKQTIEIWEIDR
jgi:hypothetical protein